MGKIIKKALRIFLWLIGGLLVLLIGFFFLIQWSVFQTYVAQKAAGYLSRDLETQVYIEKLKVVFPLDIDMKNFGIDDRKGQPILRTTRFQFGLLSLSRKMNHVKIGRIALDHPEINLITYQGDSVSNYQFIVDYFTGADSRESKPSPWSFRLLNAEISNGFFALRDYNYEPKEFGMDFKHLQISNLFLTAGDLVIKPDTLEVGIYHLSALERCGFELRRMRANLSLLPEGVIANNLILHTNQSELLLDLAFYFDDFADFNQFTEKVFIQADILPSSLNLADLALIVHEMKGMDSKIDLEGRVRGEVSNLRLQNLALNYGTHTAFKGNITLEGLPNIRETFMFINAREISTHHRDLMAFKLPSENGPVTLSLPNEVRKLGRISARARFTGFYNDFVADGTFRTGLGTLISDIVLRHDVSRDYFAFKGKLSTRRFNLGRLLEQEETLGFINMSASLDGEGSLPLAFDTKFDAIIQSVDFMGNQIDSIVVNGEMQEKLFNGMLTINDELIKLDFKGLFDLNEDPPVFNFTADLGDAWLSKLNLIERDTSSHISAKANFNFSGSNLDNIMGDIFMYDLCYHEKTTDYFVSTLMLDASGFENGRREIRLRSDVVDADFEGNFSYSQIYPAFLNILRHYLPSLRENEMLAGRDVPDQSFTSVITLKNTKVLSDLFIPDIYIDEGARIVSNFNSSEGLVSVKANAPEVSLYGTFIRNWHFDLNARNEQLNLKTGANRLLLKQADNSDPLELGLERLTLNASFSGDTIHWQTNWMEEELPANNNGDVKGFFTFVNAPVMEFRITESEMVINTVPWWFNNDNYLLIDTASLSIHQMVFQNDEQLISANGKISSDPIDKLNLHFVNWDLSNLDVILLNYGVDIGGALNGSVELAEVYANPTFLADLGIKAFVLNQEKLGDMQVNTSWDPFTKSIWIDSKILYTGNIGTITPFSLQGFYFPEREGNHLDLELQLFNFKLEVAEPLLAGILSNIKGLAGGNVFIKGDMNAPELTGNISLMRAEFKVDFTNTLYSLADVMYIEKDRIFGNNIRIFDQYGNSGLANLQFTHNRFTDWKMDLNIQANNLAGLRTTASDNSLFYGTAFATGTFSMAGAFNDLSMEVRVKSEPNTSITIPISFAVDVNDTDFIIFTDPETTQEDVLVVEEEPSSFGMTMEMDITRDAEIQIFLPYQMGNIKSTGAGTMRMHYNTTGDFSMYGDYTTAQGTFLFTLQNMINRTFTLLPGGTMRWSGDPYDADINIQAVYRTRVTLNSLPNIADEFRNRRFPVDCILTLENTLMNPGISFGIRMPNVDEEIQRQVFSAVDTTNEVIMSRQMISLLVLNSFNFSTDQTNLAATIGTSSFDFISNQLSNWLSQISKDFDIGVNYRPGDELSSEELELALSTQLFDDRVIIDGNFGMLGEQSSQRNASNIIGDLNVEVKITRDGRFRVRAFSKYNNLDFTRREAPYTQGIGAFYRREFDRFSDLWKPRPRIIIGPDRPNGNGNDLNSLEPLDEEEEK